jgi:hypothetical protein
MGPTFANSWAGILTKKYQRDIYFEASSWGCPDECHIHDFVGSSMQMYLKHPQQE